jgi:hypothetical protein
MRSFIIVFIVLDIFLGGCASPAPVPTGSVITEPAPAVPSPEADGAPEPSAAAADSAGDIQLVLENPLLLLPDTGGFFLGCSMGEPFPVWNGMIGEFFGWEYETLLDEMGRVVGFATFYECNDSVKPPSFFVIVEQFDTLGGAVEFYDHDFPPEFRSYAYEAETIDLKEADQARVRSKHDLEGESKETYTAVVEFRYRNMFGTVEATGTPDQYPEYYASSAVSVIIDLIENSIE